VNRGIEDVLELEAHGKSPGQFLLVNKIQLMKGLLIHIWRALYAYLGDPSTKNIVEHGGGGAAVEIVIAGSFSKGNKSITAFGHSNGLAENIDLADVVLQKLGRSQFAKRSKLLVFFYLCACSSVFP
jgi:hypothetical protein